MTEQTTLTKVSRTLRQLVGTIIGCVIVYWFGRLIGNSHDLSRGMAIGIGVSMFVADTASIWGRKP